jgi:uncharacterized protein (DUF427 family)
VSLTAGRGPLGPDPAGIFSPKVPAGGIVYIEPHPRRIQATIGGTTVIDTESALLVHRAGRPLAYAFPARAVGDLPRTPEPMAPGYVQVPWEAVDAWFEEGRRLINYPPNPYHRVDCRPTRRRLRVDVAGTCLVDTDETIILFETSLEPRLYVERSRVRTGLLRRSPTSSYCNYKGHATYWSVEIGSTLIEDAAWSYDDPLPESQPIAGCVSFDTAKVVLTAQLPIANAIGLREPARKRRRRSS